MTEPELTLRHLRPADYDAVYAYVSDPRVTRWLTWDAYSEPEKVARYMRQACSCTGSPDEVLGIVVNGELIGTIHLIVRDGTAVQFGFGIVPRCWGQGLGARAVQAALAYVPQSDWSLPVILWADTHRENNAARTILTRAGFAENGHVTEDRIRYTRSISNV